MKINKSLLSSLLLLFFLLGTHFSFASNEITKIRSNSLKDRLQIVLDLEEAPDFNAFSLSSPVRLVVDVKAKPSQNYRNKLNFKHRGVTLVRTGMRSDDEIRVVLDLGKDFHWEVYSLTPSKRHNHRVVIDVYDRVTGRQKPSQHVAQAKSPTKPQQAEFIPNTITLASITPDSINLESGSTEIIKPTKQKPSKAVQEKPQTVAKTSVAVAPISSQRVVIKPKGVNITKKKIITKKIVSNKAINWKKQETTDGRLQQNKIIVVIDAGHGGKDSGARGLNNTLEKNVVLQIAKRLARKINATPGMKAMLTRKDDTYISLRGRLRLARKYKADLFVSIHADAARNHSAQGSSIYILSRRGASSESARWLAKRENAVDLKYGVDIGDYDRDVGNVIMQLQQDATIEASHILAKRTLSRLKGIGKVHKRSVERAGFAVLKSPDIPSMLVETAFISNPAEERKLRSSRYQEQLATAISRGIKQYFREHIPHHLMLIEAPN